MGLIRKVTVETWMQIILNTKGKIKMELDRIQKLLNEFLSYFNYHTIGKVELTKIKHSHLVP